MRQLKEYLKLLGNASLMREVVLSLKKELADLDIPMAEVLPS